MKISFLLSCPPAHRIRAQLQYARIETVVRLTRNFNNDSLNIFQTVNRSLHNLRAKKRTRENIKRQPYNEPRFRTPLNIVRPKLKLYVKFKTKTAKHKRAILDVNILTLNLADI